MNHRQRFQTILNGGFPDRMHGVLRLNIWYAANLHRGTLPAAVQGMELHEIEALLGMGRSARQARVFRIEHENVETTERQEGNYVARRMITPRGEVSSRWYDAPQLRDQGMAGYLVEHFLKSPRDYEIMEDIADRMRFIPDYEAYEAYDRAIGDDGYPMVILHESPIHHIMISLAGYESFYLHLAEFPERVISLKEHLEAAYRRMWEVVAASPARLVMHGIHFNSSMTPPPIFKRFFMPYFLPFIERMHAAGIKVAFHGDADLSGLLELVLDCGFDVCDCFACAPLVSTTFDQARAVWKERIVIWGAVPSILLEEWFPLEDFRAYLETLSSKVLGQSHFIWGVSDNVLAGASFERLLRLRDAVCDA